MKKTIARLTILAITLATISGVSLRANAQITNKAPADKTTASQGDKSGKAGKPAKGGPFHGKLAAVDKVAKTITVGKRTFQITSETKIKKNGKPATLEDGVVGETVSGYIKPGGEGKLMATTINFGQKPAPQETDKPKAPASAEKPPKQSQPQ